MVFSSITFLFYFLPIFIACYFLTPTVGAKNVVTLLFSLVFYAWGEPRFLLILLFSIVFNYGAAVLIDGRDGSERKRALALAVIVNLAVLGVFKYANFVTGNLDALLKPIGWSLGRTNIELPLGISFFTFHCLSYLIDVYRRRLPANRNPVDVALYISLFPQLVAGPIVRYKTVARQLDVRRSTLGRASAGARIFIIGLAQKVLIADVVAPLAQVAFDHAHDPSLAEAWIGLLAYTIQIYFDFAGYSNMAIGLGVMLGFTFPRNFQHALHVALDHRVLAALAHVAVVVAARLSLHPARRQPRHEPADLSQSRDGVCALRRLARRELDLRAMGRLARRFSRVRAPGLGRCPQARPKADRLALCAPCRHGRLGIVPRRRSRRRRLLFR